VQGGREAAVLGGCGERVGGAAALWEKLRQRLLSHAGTFEESIDRLKKRSLFPFRETVHILKTLEESASDLNPFVRNVFESQDLVGGNSQETADLDEDIPVQAARTALVVGDDRLIDTEALCQFALRDPSLPT
jgi:hypothetical protein